MTTGKMIILGIITTIVVAVGRFGSMRSGRARTALLTISAIIVCTLVAFLMGAIESGVADAPVF